MPCNDSVAILSTGTSINPASPESAEFYDKGQFAYVLQRENGKLIVATSFGSLGSEWRLGTWHDFHADQSRRALGAMEVVGTADFSTSVNHGEVPNRKLPHYVFK